MIWGSQYDAIMNWMKSNNINVTSTTPTDLSIGTTSKNTTGATGVPNNRQTVSKDKLSNIYDLLGCCYEWTQEACSDGDRIRRGGYCYGSFAPCERCIAMPSEESYYNGSRLALYIK